MNIDNIYKYTNTEKFNYNFFHGENNVSGKKTAVLIWKDIQSEYIKEAIELSNVKKGGLFSSEITEYGNLVYIAFTQFTKEQIVSKKPFHWLIIFFCPNELTTVMSEWYQLLRNQSELMILTEKKQGYSATTAISPVDFRDFILNLELSISKWDGIDNSLNMMASIESVLMSKIRETEATLVIEYLTKFNAESSLLEATKKRIIRYANFSELAYRIAVQDGDKALQNYLEKLLDKIPEDKLNQFLVEKRRYRL